MGTGYTRQSAASMITGATITAAIFNAEFNQLASAFDSTSGHTHDGTTGEGPLIPLTSSVSGILPVANGGTNSSTAAGARTSLGLVIGTDVQAYNAALASIAGLTTAADKMIYTTGSNTYAVTDLTSFARTILDDANAAAVLTTIGAQPLDSDLTTIAAISPADNDIIRRDGSNWVADQLLDYHQPTILNPTVGVTYDFIDYSLNAYTVSKVIGITDTGTVTFDIRVNGVLQYTTNPTATSSGATKSDETFNVAVGDNIKISLFAKTGSPTRLQIIMVFKGSSFSEV